MDQPPLQPSVRIETPIGAIESDTGNHIVDGFMVVGMVLIFYICKKILDKHFKGKNA